MISVAVVVLSWNRRDTVLRTIERIKALKGAEVHVVVVDNASRDGSVAAVRTSHPDVTICEEAVNRGFAGGVNRALEEVERKRCAYAWLVNDDTRFRDDVLAVLLEDARAHPACGLFTPTLYDLDRNRVQFRNGVIDWSRGVMLHNVTEERLEGLLAQSATPIVPGTAMLLDMRVYRAIGGFDERFFAYWEDVDYCARAARAGFSSRVVTSTSIEHAQPGRRLERPPHYTYFMIRNEALFWRTQSRPIAGLRWRRRWLAASLSWVGDCRDAGRADNADAGIDAIWHGLRDQGGPWLRTRPAPRLFRALVLARPYALAALIGGRYLELYRRAVDG